MAVYADKRNGELTGRFRVELQRGTDRYRKRHDSLAEAKADEKRVHELWDRGEPSGTPQALQEAQEALQSGTGLKTAFDMAYGVLWRGKASEDNAWAHVRLAMRLMGPKTLLDAIDTPMVRRLIQELTKLGKSDATVNRHLSSLRTFLVWHVEQGTRKVPIDAIKFDWRKESKGRIRWVTHEEEGKLLSLVPDNVAKLIKVALETGCRRDELLTAELEQVNGTRLHLWKTKTDSPRTVPMSPETAAMLTELLTTGTMPTRRNLRSWWDRAKKQMGLEADTDFVFHCCRHTCATRLLDAGVPLLVIKEWLGHKRIETTERYTHVKPQNLEDALARVGEYRRALAPNPSVYAVPHGPPQAPRGGEEGLQAAAA